MLKPQIEIHLQEELRILKSVVSSLEMNRKRYALQEMKLVNLFQEIRGDLAREVDLTAEQEYLDEASIIHDGEAGVRIPELAPFCTRTMTSMEYIDGIKITDMKGTKKQRQELTNLVFEAILCIPCFAKKDLSLFHGDPHAGITGDFNPAHIDQAYAEKTGFKTRNAHGMMTAGFISNLLGTQLPGPGSIYMQQTLNFKAPVVFGDTVTATVEVIEILIEKKRVRLKTICTNQEGTVVLDGEAIVSPPRNL